MSGLLARITAWVTDTWDKTAVPSEAPDGSGLAVFVRVDDGRTVYVSPGEMMSYRGGDAEGRRTTVLGLHSDAGVREVEVRGSVREVLAELRGATAVSSGGG